MWSAHSADESPKPAKSTLRNKSTPATTFHQHHDVPQRVYHPPLTHHRSSPGPGKSSQTHHRPISVSPISSCDSPTLTKHFSAEDTNHSIRRIRFIKDSDEDPSGGLSLCGGPEVGLQGIYISRIQEDSLAEKCGLSPGDQILSANYTSFLDGITCQQAFAIICDSDCLLLNVLPRHEALSQQRRHHCYAWIDPNGCPVSPPPPDRDFQEGMTPEQQQMTKLNSPFRRKKLSNQQSEVRTVTITMEKGISLGLMIRGGIEYGLGVYVTGIDPNSLAEKARLKVGDQILTVNNYDFRDVMHDEAVDILKSSPRLTMRVRYVGKVPASSCAQLNDLANFEHHLMAQIPSSRCSMRRLSRPGSGQSGKRTPTLVVTDNDCDEVILEEESHKYLDENERITLAYYRNEYETQAMTVDAFVAVILELLDTPEKYSLMNRIRNVIRDQDLDKFDELVYKREEQQLLKSKTASDALKFQQFISSAGEESSESSFRGEEVDPGEEADRDSEDMDIEVGINGLPAINKEKSSSTRYLPVPQDMIKPKPESDDSDAEATHHQRFIRNPRLSRSDGLVSATSHHPNHRSNPPAVSSAAYRRMMLRRHSSSASEAPNVDTAVVNSYIDERRWSIAAHEVPQDYQHVGAGYSGGNSYDQPAGRTRSLSGGEMRMQALANPSASGDMRGSGNHLHVPGDAPYSRPNDIFFNNHSRVRRHRSLPSPTFCIKPMPGINQHRSSSFRLPSHRAISEPNGRWRVTVKKSKPILGIAIEGGVNVTQQTQPRIISIHSAGAAIECGDLQVGHILLEIDGRSTANMSHDQVAQMIAHAYYNTPHKDSIEFLVREKSRKELDLRRSSFMLLNNSFE